MWSEEETGILFSRTSTPLVFCMPASKTCKSLQYSVVYKLTRGTISKATSSRGQSSKNRSPLVVWAMQAFFSPFNASVASPQYGMQNTENSPPPIKVPPPIRGWYAALPSTASMSIPLKHPTRKSEDGTVPLRHSHSYPPGNHDCQLRTQLEHVNTLYLEMGQQVALKEEKIRTLETELKRRSSTEDKQSQWDKVFDAIERTTATKATKDAIQTGVSCCSCKDCVPDIVFQDCKHACLCMQCFEGLVKSQRADGKTCFISCPMCRAIVLPTRIEKIIWS